MKFSNRKLFLVLIAILAAAVWLFVESREEQSDQADYILAVTWQPAFCEGASNKPECRTQQEGRYDATNLTLHGLWPQPRDNWYCDIGGRLERLDRDGRWKQLPKLELSNVLRKQLQQKMPGYMSTLHRHEWIKHGTCMPWEANPETYFEISLALLDQVNRSQLGELLRKNIGREIRLSDIVGAMNLEFGQGAADKLFLKCHRDGQRTLIYEFRLSLRGDLQEEIDLLALISSAPKVKRDCRGGIVDPVGLQ